MRLPIDFHFSQGSLQDYVDCPRRFQLRHLIRLAWPAVIAEPPLDNERFMKQGAAFHRLLQQHLLGVPCERIESMQMDPELRQWWENYLSDPARSSRRTSGRTGSRPKGQRQALPDRDHSFRAAVRSQVGWKIRCIGSRRYGIRHMLEDL
jgi:hypothetical protein